MSTQRYISTSFWDDEWIQSLDPSEKLLYLYYMTNPLTNIAGVYKLAVRRVCFDTGFNSDTVGHIMQKFEAKGKAYRIGEYIALPAWPNHQKWETKTCIKDGIDAVIASLPSEILTRLVEIKYAYPIPSRGVQPPSNPPATPQQPSYSDSDPDPDIDSDTDTHTEAQEVSVGVFESIKHPSTLPKLIYDKWQVIPGVVKDADFMYWLQREYRDIATAIQGFHSDIVLKSLDNYKKERENPSTWMTAKVSSRKFFTGELFGQCREIGSAAKKPSKRCPACTCETHGPEHFDDPKDPRIGVCLNPECELYHKEQKDA